MMSQPPDSRRKLPEPARLDRVLAERQKADAALEVLFSTAPTAPGITLLAYEAAHSGSARSVLAVLLERLNDYRASVLQCSLLLIGAALPGVQHVLVDGLQRASHDRQRPDLQRLACASVLAQHSGEPLSDSFMATLRDPATAARRSLEVSLEEAVASPGLLLDYMDSVLASPPEVHEIFFSSLHDMEGSLGVLPLRLFAQTTDLKAEAVEELLRIAQERSGGRSAAAAAALFSLAPLLPPDQRAPVERAIRKLRLSTPLGAPSPSPVSPPTGSRAFLSLLDGRGTQMLWLAVPDGDEYELLNVLLHEELGVKDALGQIRYPTAALPPPAPLGSQHNGLLQDLAPNNLNREIRDSLRELVAINPAAADPNLAELLADAELEDDDVGDVPHLEVDFDYARCLLLAAHTQTWAKERSLPLGYQLFSQTIWQFAPPQPVSVALPPTPRLYSPQEVEEAVLALLESSYFVGWFIESPALYDEVEQILALMPRRGKPSKRKQEQLDAALRTATRRLIAASFGGERLTACVARLGRMAEWLALAGEEGLARITLGVAASLLSFAPEQHPLSTAMVRRGIEVAAEALANGFDLRADPERFGYFED